MNFLQFINNKFADFLGIFSGCYEYLRMLLQILQKLANSLRIKQIHNMWLPMFSLCHLFASFHWVSF